MQRSLKYKNFLLQTESCLETRSLVHIKYLPGLLFISGAVDGIRGVPLIINLSFVCCVELPSPTSLIMRPAGSSVLLMQTFLPFKLFSPSLCMLNLVKNN